MIGSRIQSYRKRKRLSLNELSYRSGVAKSYLSSIERNIQSNPSVEVLSRVAGVLGVRIEHLIRDEEQEELETIDYEYIQIAREVKKAGMSAEQVRELLAQMK